MDTEKLCRLIDRLALDTGVTETAWPGLVVARVTKPMARTPVVYSPCLCVVAQGSKRAYLGDHVHAYNPRNYLLCSLPLPIESEILEASPDEPMLALVLKLDPAEVGKLLVEMDAFVDQPAESPPAGAVVPCEMTPNVFRAITRLLEAVASPIERAVLGPALQREVLFEVLRGPNGSLLREFVLRDGSAHRVARAVTFLEKNYRRPIDVKAIAKQAGMSPSSLHEHFKRATSFTPIQFAKRLRLHDARALLLSGRGASEAAFEVGYASPSQFSREFRRMFGEPPSRVRA